MKSTEIQPNEYFDTDTEHKIELAISEIDKELRKVLRAYPMPFNTSHEFYGVIKEEIDELWDEIKNDKKEGSILRQRNEAIQVGAVAAKFIMQGISQAFVDSDKEQNKKPEQPENKIGELMVSKNGSFMTFRTTNTAFGFDQHLHWVDYTTFSPIGSNHWQPATPEQREKYNEILIEHAKSKGYKEGNYKCLDYPENTLVHVGEFEIFRGDVFTVNNDSFGNSGGNKVHDGRTGKWAEIIRG